MYVKAVNIATLEKYGLVFTFPVVSCKLFPKNKYFNPFLLNYK